MSGSLPSAPAGAPGAGWASPGDGPLTTRPSVMPPRPRFAATTLLV